MCFDRNHNNPRFGRNQIDPAQGPHNAWPRIDHDSLVQNTVDDVNPCAVCASASVDNHPTPYFQGSESAACVVGPSHPRVCTSSEAQPRCSRPVHSSDPPQRFTPFSPPRPSRIGTDEPIELRKRRKSGLNLSDPRELSEVAGGSPNPVGGPAPSHRMAVPLKVARRSPKSNHTEVTVGSGTNGREQWPMNGQYTGRQPFSARWRVSRTSRIGASGSGLPV